MTMRELALNINSSVTVPAVRQIHSTASPTGTATLETERLNLAWPTGVIYLSHVALPFPPDDPLYGQRPPDDKAVLFLGQMGIQGERGLLKIPYDCLFRLRHNPFYDFLESRALEWMNNTNDR